MSGFVVVVHWDGNPVAETLVQRLLNPIHHRGRDGVFSVARDNWGIGYAHTNLRRTEQPPTFPVANPDQTQFAVYNGHLYNAAELSHQLNHPSADTAGLILAAYAKWGSNCVQHLDGDFAFVIWDSRQQSIFAARDMFGTKTLYYQADAQKIILASEPKQILAHPTVAATVDDLVVGEYLFQNFRDIRHTFFANVQRVEVAHYLTATASHTQQTRYWNPDPTHEIQYTNRQDYYDRFRELLMESVKKRLLITDYPAFLDLSGGHDSSSIVLMAQRLIEQNTPNLPTLATVSGSFLGLDADETPFFSAVQRQLSFPSYTVEPAQYHWNLPDLNSDFWQIDAPFIDIQRGLFEQKRALMKTAQAHVLLTGLGGDEIVYTEYYLRDIAARWQFILLLKETWRASQTSWNSFGFLLRDSLKALVPTQLKLAWRRATPRRNQTDLPEWITPEYYQQYSQFPPSPPLPYAGFKSLTQETGYQYCNYPGIMWAFEMLDLQNVYDGISVIHPILDKELVNFILAIPFEKRVPAGHWKDLFQRGLAHDLPPEILNRRYKTRFDSFHRQVVQSLLPDLQTTLFRANEWASADYVNRVQAQKLFAEYKNAPTLLQTNNLWRIATLELWMRQLHRYTEL